MRRLLVTGAAGFIGCNFVRHMLHRGGCFVRVLDSLCYSGNLDNLRGLREGPDFEFVCADICDAQEVAVAMRGIDAVVHLAAESHVDRSIRNPRKTAETNIMGTLTLLEAARDCGVEKFVYVSTDEVYGEAHEGSKTEADALDPRSPYSATKAGADLLCHAYHATYGLPVVIHRATNNYGPYQYPEKLIPLFCYRALRNETLPVYGDGLQVRDWLHVSDNCRAIETLLERGEPGEAYNVPGGNERQTIEVVRMLLDELGKPESLIDHVKDRPGNDVRYSLDGSKLEALGWWPMVPFEEGLRATVRWYAHNLPWLEESISRDRGFMSFWYIDRGWN